MRPASCCRTRPTRSVGCSRQPRRLARRFAASGPREPLRVLGYATNGVADELALMMLADLLADLPVIVEITTGRMLASELVSLVQGARGRRSSASPICHPVRRQRRAIWSRGSAPPFPRCGSSSGAGPPRRWPTRARKGCGRPARRSWPRRLPRSGPTWGAWPRFRVCR